MSEKESKKGWPRRLFLRILLVVFGLGVILLTVVWWCLPGWLEKYASQKARDAGFRDVSLHVEHIDPWTTTIAGIRIVDDKTEMALASLVASYEPDRLIDGVVREIDLSGLHLEVDLQAWIDESAKQDELGQTSDETIEDWIHSYMEKPVVERIRLRDALLVADLGRTKGEARLNANLATGSDNLRLDLNGTFGEAPLTAVVFVLHETNATKLTVEAGLAELANLGGVLAHWLADEDENASLPVRVLSGAVDVVGKAHLVGNDVNSVVVEANASDLSLAALSQKFRLPKLFLSLSERSEGEWSLLAKGTAEANATGRVEDWEADAVIDANSCEVSLRTSTLKTFSPFPEMHFSNLRLPRWKIPFTDPARLPVGESKTLQFEDFSLNKDSFTFNLYEGELTIAFPAEGEIFGVQFAPTDAVLPLQGVTFRNFSFSGAVEPFREPYLSLPQSLSVESILLGEESLLENVAMSFRLVTMSKLVVDSLALSFDEAAYELNPAKLTMEQLGNDVLSLDFNGSTFSLPDLELKVEGVRAQIRLASVDPLATTGPQELHFDTIRYGSFAITDGRLLFSLDANGTLSIHGGEAKLLGGFLVFEPTRFDLFGEETYVTLRLRNLDGSRIALLLEKFDGEITGTFSGRIPLRKAAGQLDFTGGFLELDQGSPGRLRYRSDGLLTEGMQPVGSEYKLRRNTELALKDLDVKRLRLDFVEENGEPQVLGQVQGKAQIDKKTTIDLNYRPRIQVDLWALLQEINFETLDLD